MVDADDRDDSDSRGFAALLCELMTDELAKETDEATALRKAILTLLIAHEDCDPLFEGFHTFLLTRFKPLASKFTEHQHVFLGAEAVSRGRTRDGSIRVFLPESIAERLATYAQDLEREEN